MLVKPVKINIKSCDNAEWHIVLYMICFEKLNPKHNFLLLLFFWPSFVRYHVHSDVDTTRVAVALRAPVRAAWCV